MSRRPTSNENGPAVRVRITQPPSLRQLFGILFFDPASLFYLPQKNWKRALALFLSIAFVGGLLIEASSLPGKKRRAEDWGEFFRHNVQRVQFEKNRIVWEKSFEVPQVFSFDDWHIKFAENDAEFDARKLGTSRKKGIWITDHTIIHWQIRRGSNEAVQQVLYNKGQLFDKISTAKFWPVGYTIEGDEFVKQTTSVFSQLVPFFLLITGFLIMLQAFVYTLVFTAIPYFMGSPLAGAGFTNLLALYMYIGIPPLIFASIYSILPLPLLDFGVLYVGGFILYLMFIMWQYRQREADKADASE